RAPALTIGPSRLRSCRRAEEAANRLGKDVEPDAGRGCFAAELVERRLRRRSVDLEAGQLDEPREGRAPLVGALEMAGERSRVREGVDDLGLGAGRIEIGREE